MRTPALVLAVILFSATRVFAQSPSDPPPATDTAPATIEAQPTATTTVEPVAQRRFGIRLDIGYFQASLVGIALAYRVHPNVQLELSSQFLLPGVTFLPRFSFGSEMHRAVLAPGVGVFFTPIRVSHPLQIDRFTDPPEPLWSTAFHLVLEVGYELRLNNGWALLAAAGVMGFVIPDVSSGVAPHVRVGVAYFF